MGFGIKELLIILVIVIILFGTSRLKTIGSDLGNAIKGFRKSVNDDDAQNPDQPELDLPAADNKPAADKQPSDSNSN